MGNINDDETRSLNNRLSDLRIKKTNIDSDLMHLKRVVDEHQLKERRLKKEIQRKKMELDEMKQKEGEFEKKKFELENDKRMIKKKIEEIIAQKRSLNIY
jgi:chromosome segregation ATPase